MSFLDNSRILGRSNPTSEAGHLAQRLHIDVPMFVALLLISGLGLVILYSASGQDMDVIVRQALRMVLAFGVLLIVAQVTPDTIENWSPWLFALGLILLLAVLGLGHIGKGAQRWLNLGLFRFQPSEIMKLAVPMMIAWYLADSALPPNRLRVLAATAFILIPTLLIAKEPDLGTALLVGSAGAFVLLFAGIRWRIVLAGLLLLAASAPLAWHFMHGYQRERVLTFLNPENDPLGAGYHIIQSTIAIGSGGIYGKGWLNGTQSHLDFLPERKTDFIFAVFSEEFGFMGFMLMLALYLFVVGRGLYIATQAQDTYSRLVAGSITLTFFIYVFVNIGMVSGLLPVVGLPLPLVSYGGTSMVTLMAGFGILMSIHTHRKLLAT